MVDARTPAKDDVQLSPSPHAVLPLRLLEASVSRSPADTLAARPGQQRDPSRVWLLLTQRKQARGSASGVWKLGADSRCCR
jgi:hypothetical protein